MVSSLSWPERIEYHAVEDAELARLMRLEKPYSASIALVCAGAALGLLPQALPAAYKVWSGQAIESVDAIYLIVLVGTVVLGIATGVSAWQGQSGAQKALEAIRARPRIALPKGHPAAPG